MVSLGVIYGANASGKSNLLRAINLLRRLVVDGVDPDSPIPVDRFLLSGTRLSDSEPTFLEIYFIKNNEMFCYGIECDVRFIWHEWLRSGKEDIPIFERRTNADGVVVVDNYDQLAERSEIKPERIQLVAEGTRPNKPFLTQANEQNVTFLRSIYSWMDASLSVRLTPTVNVNNAFETRSYEGEMLENLGDFLRKADTGIERVEVQEDPLDVDQLDDHDRNRIEKWLQDDDSANLTTFIGGRRVTVKRDAATGNVYRSRLRAIHSDSNDKGTALDWANESDGTRRMAELWQMIFISPKRGLTLFIDEMERSLHPELVRFLVEQWRVTPPPNSQLIFTTHNDNFLEDDLLRRDEVWFVSKNRGGASRMVSEVQFKLVEGVTRQRAYLDGMYGGVPNISDRRFHFVDRNQSPPMEGIGR